MDTFLGVRITRDRGLRRMWLSQAGYVQDMLVELGMEHCKPVATPELTSSGSSSPTSSTFPYQPPGDDVSLAPGVKYRTLIGKPNHAANWTRPDIRSAVRELSCH